MSGVEVKLPKYVVNAIYREDVVEGSNEPPPYSKWMTFNEDEYGLMLEAMWAFVRRCYATCPIRAEQCALEVQYKGVLHVYDVPRFTAVLPDKSVIVVFKVGVKF
jgi:hypothetical protein